MLRIEARILLHYREASSQAGLDRKGAMMNDSDIPYPSTQLFPLPDDGTYPNSIERPALLLLQAFSLSEQEDAAATIESSFERNGWTHGWRDGVFSYHHYHSTAHEVLGCFAGEAQVQLGGPNGPTVTLRRGDALVIPAGVSHKRIAASADFSVVGCYAGGREYDMKRGQPGERPAADENIAQVPLPSADPVFGAQGPVVAHWT